MFEGLKKKLTDAVKIFTKKEEKEIEQKVEPAQQPIPEVKQEKMPEPKAQTVHHHAEKAVVETKPVQKIEKAEEKKQEPIKLSLGTKLKSVFVREITLNESEVDSFLEDLRVSLLESDVSYDTTEDFINSLRENLHSTKIDARNIQKSLIEQVRKSLFEVLGKSGKGIEVNSFIKDRISTGKLPVKILFLGPNGTGKTTTMAKLAYSFKKSGFTSVLSASDTFRAAAIEQTEHHANKVGVPVIKSKYGADPASIAFDAIAYAKAHNLQIVLIDSAGRQETNKNLITEMQKMVRIAQPDLIVFVGESTAGNQLSEQIKEFNKFIKIDGIILTKLDCDAKGGNAISIANVTGIPLLFLGTGESYDALVPYTPEFIVDAIVPSN